MYILIYFITDNIAVTLPKVKSSQPAFNKTTNNRNINENVKNIEKHHRYTVK